MSPFGRPLLGLVCTILAATSAAGHTRSTSYSSWEIDGTHARVLFRIPQLELTRLPWGIVSPPGLSEPLAAYIAGALRLEVDGVPCEVSAGPRALQAPAERAHLEWELRCPEGVERKVTSDLLREVAPGHLHFARLRGGSRATERVLTRSERSWQLPSADEGQADAELAGSGIGTYVRVGVDHIVTGYDHLVFLLGLLLLARRVGEVATIVTGFTLAHSITLALAALGRVHPDGAAVEALIGLSIALVAAENAWQLSGRRRVVPGTVVTILLTMAAAALAGWGHIPALSLAGLALFSACYFALLQRRGASLHLRSAVAFCFGLVHGFGFAGVLSEIALPQGRMLPALLGFNLGVELGQLVLVAMAWPLLVAITRLRDGRLRAPVLEWGSAAVCGLGVFWMVSRAYGS